MQALIDRWLKHRSMPPMSFLVEISPFTFAQERRYYLARQGSAVVGILVAVPVYQRQGWFFEDVLRDPAAPNGTAESLIDFAMREVAREGATFVTLGLAPLAGDARWHRVVRALTSGLYNFDGLYAFKSKLRPDAWDPIFVAWPSKVSRVAAVYDVLDAFAGGKLVRFGLRTVFRAPAVVLFTLGVLALPWAALVAGVDTEQWFPSRRIQIAWSVFDLTMGAALVALARRWRRPLAQVACAAAATDAVVTSIEAASYNLRRVRGWRDLAVIAVAIAAPVTVAAILTGGLRRRSAQRRCPT
jgi:phosphatidylglycerol lysyltransferase